MLELNAGAWEQQCWCYCLHMIGLRVEFLMWLPLNEICVLHDMMSPKTTWREKDGESRNITAKTARGKTKGSLMWNIMQFRCFVKPLQWMILSYLNFHKNDSQWFYGVVFWPVFCPSAVIFKCPLNEVRQSSKPLEADSQKQISPSRLPG